MNAIKNGPEKRVDNQGYKLYEEIWDSYDIYVIFLEFDTSKMYKVRNVKEGNNINELREISKTIKKLTDDDLKAKQIKHFNE